jgi:hypothetical protein
MQRLEPTLIGQVVREHPCTVFVVMYAVCFLACSIAVDLWQLGGASPLPGRYGLPLGMAPVFWLALRSWAKRQTPAAE